MSTGLELRSLISKSGELTLSLAKPAIPEPGPEQVVVKVEAGQKVMLAQSSKRENIQFSQFHVDSNLWAIIPN